MPRWFRFKRNLFFPHRAEQRAAWDIAKMISGSGKLRETDRNTVEIPLEMWNKLSAALDYCGRWIDELEQFCTIALQQSQKEPTITPETKEVVEATFEWIVAAVASKPTPRTKETPAQRLSRALDRLEERESRSRNIAQK